jgi:Uma2 family endonuclease
MAPLAARQRVSEAEFLSLPESLDHIELVDGEVVLSPAPSVLHQEVVRNLCFVLTLWARAHPPAAVGLSPLDVRLAPGRIVQPDLFVLLQGFPKAATGPLDAIPDLTIEVLSARTTYDRLAKRLLYAEAGVREYWVVDPQERTLEQIVGLETVAIRNDRIVSHALPELTIELPTLFPYS